MKNQDLIKNLSSDLKPVRVLPSPQRLSLFVVLGFLTGVLVVLFLTKIRSDLSLKLQSGSFLLSLLLLLSLGVLSAVAAASLTRPEARPRFRIRRALLIGGATAISALLVLLIHGLTSAGEPALDHWGWKCSAVTLWMSLIGSFAGGWLLRKGASTRPLLSGFLVSFGALCFSWVGVGIECGFDGALHLAAWHYALPAFVGVFIGWGLSRLFFRWTL